MKLARVPETAAVALLVGALLAFAMGLLTSKPPPVPSIVVQGEPLLKPGTPIALRFSAAMPKGTKRSTLEGTVRVDAGNARAPLEGGTARVEAPPGEITADLVVDGEVHATLHTSITASTIKLTPKLQFQTWQGDVIMGPREGMPLYPVDGQVSGRLPSKVLLLDDDGVKTVDASPQMQGAQIDGRVLRVDRSGVRLEAPLEVESGGTVDVTVFTSEKRAVGLDLLAGGVVVDAQNVDVDKEAHVKLRLGRAAPGDVVVVHAGGLWPDELGRFAVLRVRDDKPLLQWLETQAKAAGAPEGEPLLAWLDKHPSDTAAAHAVLQRMWPGKLRAPKLQATVTTSAPSAALWLDAYLALAAACVVVVGALGLVRLPGKRLQALLATLVLAGLLGGLATVLVVTAR